MRTRHDPDRDRCTAALIRELRRRHDANPRRMYARRMDDIGEGEFPAVNQAAWRVAVAARWWSRHKSQED